MRQRNAELDRNLAAARERALERIKQPVDRWAIDDAELTGGHTSHLPMCRTTLGKTGVVDQLSDQLPCIHKEFSRKIEYTILKITLKVNLFDCL